MTDTEADGLTDEWRKRIEAAPPRVIAGHWTTRELANLTGRSATAILMHVQRGNLEAIEQGQPQTNFYTDAAVMKWLQGRSYGGGQRKEIRDVSADGDQT